MKSMIFALLFTLGLAGASAGQDAPSEAAATAVDTSAELSTPSPDDWRFEVKPYLWLTAVGVDAEIGPVSAEADMEFKDLLDHLDAGLMLHGEAYKGPWGMFGDIMWTRLSADEDGFGPAGGGDFDFTMNMTLLEAGGMYRFQKNRFSFEPLFGLRAMFINSDVEISGASGGSVDRDGSTEWAEPMIGMRVGAQITKKFTSSLRADVSGFGVGSEITYNINSEFRYHFNDRYAMTFGYRYLYIDYEDGNAEIELTMNGPVLGFAFSF